LIVEWLQRLHHRLEREAAPFSGCQVSGHTPQGKWTAPNRSGEAGDAESTESVKRLNAQLESYCKR
jgi:hypothetical protein